MKTPRLCIYCSFFHMIPEDSGYGAQTPGDAFHIECDKSFFEFYGNDLSTSNFREIIEKALTCGDFKKVEIKP